MKGLEKVEWEGDKIHGDGHCDLLTNSAKRAELVKILILKIFD